MKEIINEFDTSYYESGNTFNNPVTKHILVKMKNEFLCDMELVPKPNIF